MTEDRDIRRGVGAVGTTLLMIVSGLLCLGALMVYSAGATVMQEVDWLEFWRYTTGRRVAMVPVVWLVLAIVSHLNYRRFVINERYFGWSPALWFMIVSLIMLGAVLIPGVGTEVNASRRWLKFGPAEYGLTIQPSELAKWTVVMFLAGYCWLTGTRMREFKRGFVLPMGVLVTVVGLIGVEDFGTAALVGAVGMMVLLVGGMRWWYPLLLLPLAGLAFYFMVYCNAYRWDRVRAFLHNEETAQAGEQEPASVYHLRQSKMALGSGGLWGVGLGKGKVKLGYLPEDTTDFVFAVIGEELGLAGCALVIGLYMGLMVCSMVIVHRARDRLGMLLAIGISATMGAQAVMNLMVVTGLAPTKGIALPFVSAGGSGLMLTAISAGVLINIARSEEKAGKRQEAGGEI